MKVLKVDQSASSGIAMGRAFLYQPPKRQISDYQIKADEVSREIKRFEIAVREALKELEAKANENAIFAAHVEMVKDITIHEAVINKIKEENKNVEKALWNVFEDYIMLFESMEDVYMRERSVDLKDIRERMLGELTGIKNTITLYPQGSILIAKDLTPSDTASLDLSKIQGLITRDGGITSHVAILAKSFSLPALVGVKGILDEVKEKDYLILDGYKGEIYINPDESILHRYQELKKKYQVENERMKAEEGLEAITTDGKQIHLCANVGSTEEVKQAITYNIDGIGLFRSEFLYLGSDHFPTQEEQFQAYKQALDLCKGEITIRTLDIGGDKTLPYYKIDKEDNPFLGYRAIRISLEEIEMFQTQLKAILRASAYGKIRILLPMIISVEEVLKAKEILAECMKELTNQGVDYDPNILVGIMIETPASVICAKELAKEVDFFSIGTNDLTQYILAVDRGNAKIAKLYNSYHPAVLRSIMHVTEMAHQYGIKVGMCGEFAGNDKATKLLIGLGLDELSMTCALIPNIKYYIRRISLESAVELAKKACNMASIEEVINLLN